MKKDAAEMFFKDHEWSAQLMGGFIQLLVDAGSDAVVCRIISDHNSAEEEYVRHLDVFLVPQSQIKEYLLAHPEIVLISKYLKMLIEIQDNRAK